MERYFEITSDCFARTAPGMHGQILGTCRTGGQFPFGYVQSDDGRWMLIEFDNQNAWVPGDHGKLV